MLFVNKQKQIEKQFSQYCAEVMNCIGEFRHAFECYLKEPDREVLRESYSKVHKFESRCDDIRGEISVLMYSKALFPESRGDILTLLEAMDRIPNQAESAVRKVLSECITIPQEYHAELSKLVDVCCRSADAMITAATKLFTDYTNATVAVGKIDEIESEGDYIESGLIESIFASDLDGFQKLTLRDLVKHVVHISDWAENVGDRIRVVVAKRSI